MAFHMFCGQEGVCESCDWRLNCNEGTGGDQVFIPKTEIYKLHHSFTTEITELLANFVVLVEANLLGYEYHWEHSRNCSC